MYFIMDSNCSKTTDPGMVFYRSLGLDVTMAPGVSEDHPVGTAPVAA